MRRAGRRACQPEREHQLPRISATIGSIALAFNLTLAVSGAARAETAETAGNSWRGTLGIGTTAIEANNVLPLPFGLGVSLLAERDFFGIEGAVHADLATLCDYRSASDSYCGVLWVFDVAPRATLGPRWAWRPYGSLRFQLTHSETHGWVPAVGPRAGLRYRGRRFGFYAEAGPSFVSSDDGRFGQFVSEGRWFPHVSIGMTASIW